MKKVLIGVGLGLAAASQAQAWDGGIEDMRTMEANEAGPVVRIKSVKVSGWHGGKYHTSPETYRCTPDGRCHDGWRRLKSGSAQSGSASSDCRYGRHTRTAQPRTGYQQHAAQQTRAQRQAYYAAQERRKAQLLAQKRHAAQVAAQQRQQALQKQRVLAAQRKAAAIQQQRLAAQRKAIALQQQRLAAQRQAAQQQRLAAQRQAAAHRQITPQRVAPLPVHYPAQEYQYVEVQANVYKPVAASQMVSQVAPGCHGASQMSSCSGYQRSASVNTHRVRTISKHRAPGCFG